MHLKVIAIKSNFIGAKPSHMFKLIITFGLLLLDLELDTILCSFTPPAGSAKSCPGISQQHQWESEMDDLFSCAFQLHLPVGFLGNLDKMQILILQIRSGPWAFSIFNRVSYMLIFGPQSRYQGSASSIVTSTKPLSKVSQLTWSLIPVSECVPTSAS